MNKSLNEPTLTICMKIVLGIYIICVISVPIFCLWLSFEMVSDPGNFTAGLLSLFTTAIGWPLLYYSLHLLCWNCCVDCFKRKFIVRTINRSKLPHLQGDLKKNDDNKEPIALTTSIQMSEQNK